jgi:hypothetical protein
MDIIMHIFDDILYDFLLEVFDPDTLNGRREPFQTGAPSS